MRMVYPYYPGIAIGATIKTLICMENKQQKVGVQHLCYK